MEFNDYEKENISISDRININKKNSKKIKFNNNNIKNIKKWKPYQYLTAHEKRKLEKEKEKKKNQIFLSTEKFWRNLDFDNKFINLINKPQTPHNTGQFLTHNFNIGNKKINNIIEEDDSNSLCVSGSMLNQNKNNLNECPDLDFDYDMNKFDTKTNNSTYKEQKE